MPPDWIPGILILLKLYLVRLATQENDKTRIILWPIHPKKAITDPAIAAPSIQHVYVHTSMIDGPKSCRNDDKGPYIFHVSREVEDLANFSP